MTYTIIKGQQYKGHTLRKVLDAYKQETVRIDDCTTDYASFADAKRVINGLTPKYIIR